MDRILRYTLVDRIVHWMAALVYVYLLLTGLAFWTPKLWWIAEVLGGGQVVRAWHPWAGVLFTGTVVWMWWQWRGDMRGTEADRVWRRAILRYVRNEDEHLPTVGRFNAGQKQFFWIMFFAGLVLLGSGLVLWFTDSVPWKLRSLRYGAIVAHAVAFLFTAAAFIVHLYMGTAVVTGGFTSIVRGEVSREWAEAHHALWLEERSRKIEK